MCVFWHHFVHEWIHKFKKKFKCFCCFLSYFVFFSIFSTQIRSYNEIILMFPVCKLVEDIICYKCVYFGTIWCINEYTNSYRRYQLFLLFSEQFYEFSLISLQIRCYNEMILTTKVGNHIEEVIRYKCVYFGTIWCINEYTNSSKIPNCLLFSELFYIFS